jgi:hypothetical protein
VGGRTTRVVADHREQTADALEADADEQLEVVAVE